MSNTRNHQLDRRAKLRGVTIEHPRFIDARDRLLDAWQLGLRGAEPGYIALVGPSRSGKTRVMDSVYEDIMRNVKGRRPQKMVRLRLHDEAVKNLTFKSVVSLYVSALEDDVVGGHTVDLRQRAKSGSAGLGVEIVEIDEAQHLVRDRKTAAYGLANGIKTLIDDIAKPFVLVGTETLASVIEHNEQLFGRMIDYIEFPKFNGDDPADYAQFVAVLLRYDQELPFDEWCFLWDDVMAHAMYAATDGLIGHVVHLVAKAGGLAIMENARRIEPAHLAFAWQTLRSKFTTLKKNPFEGITLPSPCLKSDGDLLSAAE